MTACRILLESLLQLREVVTDRDLAALCAAAGLLHVDHEPGHVAVLAKSGDLLANPVLCYVARPESERLLTAPELLHLVLHLRHSTAPRGLSAQAALCHAGEGACAGAEKSTA